MKLSTVSFVAIYGATAVSARAGTCKKAPLKLENFGNFTMLTPSEAEAGIVKAHNGTTYKIDDDHSKGYPSGAYPASTYSLKPAYYSAHSEASASSAQNSASVTSGAPGSGYGSSQAASTTEYSATATKTSLPYKAPTETSYASQSSASASASGSASASSASASSAGVSATLTLSSSASVSTGSSSASITSSSTASSTLSVSTTSSSSSAPTTSSSAAPTCEERIEWRSYPSEQRHKFSAAFKCLMDAPKTGSFAGAKNRYEEIVAVHQSLTDSIHGNNVFLLWHRYYVWTLEQIMRDECGFTGAFPWWDETLDAGNFAGSSIFTAEYFGSLSRASGSSGTCVTNGYFANTVAHIGPGTDNVAHCLSRGVNEQLTAEVTEAFVETCNSRTTYATMENCAEYGPHAYGHNGVGSVMADMYSSPSDPSFFLHHLFIDRNFWLWQNGNAAAKTTRNAEISGCLDNNTGLTPCNALTLNTVISMGGLRPDVTVADILDTQKGTMCYSYSY